MNFNLKYLKEIFKQRIGLKVQFCGFLSIVVLLTTLVQTYDYDYIANAVAS